MDKRVFYAILGAAGLIFIFWVVFSQIQEYREEQARSQAWAAVLKAANDPDPMGLVAAQQRKERSDRWLQDQVVHMYAAQAEQHVSELRTHHQREDCIGGTIVLVTETTNSYVQELDSTGRPRPCRVALVDRPSPSGRL